MTQFYLTTILYWWSLEWASQRIYQSKCVWIITWIPLKKIQYKSKRVIRTWPKNQKRERMYYQTLDNQSSTLPSNCEFRQLDETNDYNQGAHKCIFSWWKHLCNNWILKSITDIWHHHLMTTPRHFNEEGFSHYWIILHTIPQTNHIWILIYMECTALLLETWKCLNIGIFRVLLDASR